MARAGTQALRDHPGQPLPEAVRGVRVGVEPAHRRRQLALTELALEPAGEVVLLRAVAQPGLEQVIGDGGAAHHGQRLGELGQAGRPMEGGEHEGDRIHEVELLSGRRRAQRLARLEVAFDDGHDPVAQLAEVVEAHGVDGREPLAELLLLQGVGHPEGEVVGRLGGEILVLDQEVMRVVEDDRERDRAQVLHELREIRGATAGELGEGETRPELKRSTGAIDHRCGRGSATIAASRRRASVTLAIRIWARLAAGPT